MNGIYITDARAIFTNNLTVDDTIIKGKSFYFGKLEQDFPKINNEKYDLRCNRILKFLADKLDLSKFDKSEIGIVIGTTNSGIQEFETTQNKHHAELGNPSEFLRWYLGTTNYAASVSTACTSGIKAFSTAVKLLQNNVCKVVIVGGIDTLASMPSYGFHALEVLSHKKTNPFSKNRDGISIGEGGALFVLTKEKPLNDEAIQILGLGETSDAYHSATPNPKGEQAQVAIEKALQDANLTPKDIGYINLHGTGTISNDVMEANAIYNVFGSNVPVSSTKPYTGHCLGAAASIETFICYEILKNKKNLPLHKYDGEYDKTLPILNLIDKEISSKNINNCMCTSFGFGGTNAVIIIGKTQEEKYLPVEKVLPHAHPMILIDRILDVNMKEQMVKASVKIHENKIFFDKEIDGISPLVGIEFMAQTIGCYAFYKSPLSNPKLGFLLGTRQYENSLEKFENGKTYTITAKEIYGDNELVSFECFIYNENTNGDWVAKAIINAFQPQNADGYLEKL